MKKQIQNLELNDVLTNILMVELFTCYTCSFNDSINELTILEQIAPIIILGNVCKIINYPSTFLV